MAISVLGARGYKPREVLNEVPLALINQIIHAHILENGGEVEWANHEANPELLAKFEELRKHGNRDQGQCWDECHAGPAGTG